MSLGIFLFPFRVTRWNTAAQWCMAWCPDAQDASLGVASTPNCGGFFGEHLHDDSKKELSFGGDVYRLIFETSPWIKMWRWEAKCCQFLSPVFPSMNHDLKWGAGDSTNSPLTWLMSSLQVLELCKKGFANKLDGDFLSGKQLEGKHLKMKHHWEGLLLCVFCFLQAKVL